MCAWFTAFGLGMLTWCYNFSTHSFGFPEGARLIAAVICNIIIATICYNIFWKD